MSKNKKIEDSLNKIFSNSGYKMVDVSSKEITSRKALAAGEIILSSEIIEMIKNKKISNSIKHLKANANITDADVEKLNLNDFWKMQFKDLKTNLSEIS